MEINKDRTGTDMCVLFAPQDGADIAKKNLAANLMAVIDRMTDIRDTKLFIGFPGQFRFEEADHGVKLVFFRSDGDEEAVIGEVTVKDYGVCSEDDIDEKTIGLTSPFKIDSPDRLSESVLLDIIRASIEVKKSGPGKEARAEHLCSADELAAYVLFRTRAGSGVNVSRYNAESLNTLLFYIRALSIVSGTGPVYKGPVCIADGRLETPANEFLEKRENGGRVYLKAEYADTLLPDKVKELADTVLSMAPAGPDADAEIKKSLDFHPCYTNRMADPAPRGSRCWAISDNEIFADFSTWDTARKVRDEKARLLAGPGFQLSLPILA